MGMNEVTGELIAVKQINLAEASGESQLEEIEKEVSVMRDLRHRNIVTLLGTERVDNTLNILMEYVPGKSLLTLLKKFGAFSEEIIRSYTSQILCALAYCHANGVVHRDIKCANILVDTQGNLKLADFGSAERAVDEKDSESQDHSHTPLWTAPEMLKGPSNRKVDIWSLGCVLIELASADVPWAEKNFANPFSALYHIGNTEEIPAIPENLSSAAKEFIMLCLTRAPENRPDAHTLLRHKWVMDNSKG
mmetsp:Transcript_43241/g.84746  ORF Transcript_43241/g.84746 Transcript_43241/m.84746 type:complete len:249 (+) Transcript_43241:57-803(+)